MLTVFKVVACRYPLIKLSIYISNEQLCKTSVNKVVARAAFVLIY